MYPRYYIGVLGLSADLMKCTLQRRKVEGVKADVDYTFQIRPDASFVNYCGIPKDVGVEIECYLDGGKQSTCDPW